MRPATIVDVSVGDELIEARLSDGRVVGIPVAWSTRLANAEPGQRRHWQLWADGTTIAWPDVDEHIGLWTLLGVREDDLYEALGWEVGPGGPAAIGPLRPRPPTRGLE